MYLDDPHCIILHAKTFQELNFLTRDFPCSRLPTSKIELTIYVANWPMNVQREMTYVPYNGIPVLILNFHLSDELILGFRTLKWIFYFSTFLFCNIQFDLQSGQALTYILSSSSWQKWDDFEIFLYYHPLNTIFRDCRKKFIC